MNVFNNLFLGTDKKYMVKFRKRRNVLFLIQLSRFVNLTSECQLIRIYDF